MLNANYEYYLSTLLPIILLLFLKHADFKDKGNDLEK